MKSFRQSSLLTVASLLSSVLLNLSFGSNSKCLAGPQSILDPYSTIQAPAGKGKPNLESKPAENTTTYVTIPMDDDSQKQSVLKVHHNKPPKVASVPKAKKEKAVTSSDQSQTTTSKLAQKSKAVTNGVTDSTKKMGNGIASGAKTSSNYFVKSAKAFGNGIKSAGGYIKDGTSAMGSKTGHTISDEWKGTTTELKDKMHVATDYLKITKPNPAKENPALKETPVTAQANKQAKNDPSQPAANQNVISKTFGKLNVFGHGKKEPVSQTANADSSDTTH